MKKFMTVCCLLISMEARANQMPESPNPMSGYNNIESQDFAGGYATQPAYVPKSGGLPSMDFIKRFGKHCTSHKNMIGRQVSGLCDDANVCDPKQYKACYKLCIQGRKQEDEKTMYIFGKLASCNVDPSDKESVDIFNQANLRLNKDKKQVITSKTFKMPVEEYQPERTAGVRSVRKTLNPFSTNCTTHKNKLGMTTSGVCDNGKQCQTANYKKCYNECVAGRPADDKTPYILKKLNDCRANPNDLELGAMAKDVLNKYHLYEIQKGREALNQRNSKGLR